MIERPPPLNRQPTGLLGFFGIKNGGRNPQTLIEPLSPVVDLLPWYLNSAPRFAANSATVVGDGNVITHAPGQFAAWYVSAFDVGFDLGATELCDCWLLRFNSTNTVTAALTDGKRYNTVGSHRLALQYPIWLMPGESIGFAMYNVSHTGNIGTFSNVRFTELSV